VADSDVVHDAADELYALPPGEFTRARDARVKEIRKQDREAADAIKRLRKPTVAAWALNQLARRRASDVGALLEAGERLRAAQEELLAGGDRSAFQEAAAAERELVAGLSADATAIASEAGERGGGLQEKVAATLHAAALDEETAGELRGGRLVREREAIGGFGAPGGGPVAAAAPARAGAAKEKRPAKARSGRGEAEADGRGRSAGAEEKAAGRGRATRGGAKAEGRGRPGRGAGQPAGRGRAAADDDAEQRRRVSAARTDERHAERELDAAMRALEHAQERADAAEAHAAEAAERARKTAERLKEAKRAATAARKAHDRAARALANAEKGSARR
jgi:hypothetical protein